MNTRNIAGAAGAAAIVVLAMQPVLPWGAAPGAAQAQQSSETKETEVTDTHDPNFKPEFTEAFLNDPQHLESGKEIWEDQCRHCHGRSAYPGKAPKLKPKTYEPDFVYERVTNGFRKMPPWKDVYTDEERMNVVAYILSRKFAP